MPDGNADVSIKPDELKALKPRLEEIKSAIQQMGDHLALNDTKPEHFGLTPNAAEAAKFFQEQYGRLADTSMAVNFVKTFIEAIDAAIGGAEGTEKELSDKFKSIRGSN